MENKLKALVLISAVSMILCSCEKVDFAGMVENDSANERFRQSMRWNNEHGEAREIHVPEDDYVIMVMGDSHIGKCGNFDRFLRTATENGAAAVLLAGDLTNGHADDYDNLEKHLPERSSMNYFVLAGNHDMNFGGWDEYRRRFGTSTYYFTVKTPAASDIYICLETGGATLGKLQLAWLTGILKSQRQLYRHCFVITHNNFFRNRRTEASLFNTDEMQCLINLFVTYNVEKVFMAHDHHTSDDFFGNTEYIVVPAVTEEAENPGFLKLIVSTSCEMEFENL